MEIRNIQDSDYYNSYLELLEQLTVVNKDLITFEDFYCFIDSLNKNHNIFVIEDEANGKIIATATVLIEQKLIHSMGKVGHIEDVVCHKDYRGKHIGKHLIDYCSDYCFSRGCYKVILDCSEHNVGFYEKCGFKNNGFQMAKYR